MDTAPLEHFALTELDKLALQLPVFPWRNTEEPVWMNAIFSTNEWKMDSPQQLSEGTQDWIHWFASDPQTGTYLELFFERLESQLAVVWVQLRVDGRRLILKETVYRDSSEGSTYSAGGVRLECNAPMRLWRLAVNAIMDDTDRLDGSRGVHVRLGARAAMSGHTFELPKQLKPSFLAKRYCKEENFASAKSKISRCTSRCQAIAQPNTIYAEIIVDGQRGELLLFGSRLKFFGDSDFLQSVQIQVGYAENGTTYTAIETSGRVYGYCSNPTSYVEPIRKGRWRLNHSKNKSMNSQETLSMHNGAWTHKFMMRTLHESQISFLNASKADAWTVRKNVGDLLVREEKFGSLGTVFRLRGVYAIPERKQELLRFLQYPLKTTGRLVLSTIDTECKNPELTGGKGSSLAVLTDISQHFKRFTVPKAVILTVNAYNIFVRTPEIAAAVGGFLRDSKQADVLELKKASETCASAISAATLPENLFSELQAKLLDVFGPSWESRKFAVRSSAVGEDSEEMSAAGQMTTYLGTKGKEEISTAIVNCWASQFALNAVNYKRQYGQELNCPMAVIVQEMVSADCSGVMFTCDPVSSNPSSIYIAANFGLGESVVSAVADPDTYSFYRRQNELVLKARTRGAKDRMIVESEFGKGTEEKIVAMDVAQNFCLTNDCATEIASIGATLSEITDSPRDIEWAVKDGKIYLLRSRPVASFLRESDFEVRHDLNSALYTKREILSRGNLEEVMPGALSPMGISISCSLMLDVFMKTMSDEMKAMKTELSQFTRCHSINIGKKSFMNFSKNTYSKSKSFMENSSVTMFGFDISDHEAMENGILHPSNGSSYLMMMKFLYKTLRSLKKQVEFAKTKSDQICFNVPNETATLALFFETLRYVPETLDLMEPLMTATILSNIYNVLTLNILKSSQGETKNTPEIMILLSKLLRSRYEVESARIPKELKALSNSLAEDPCSDRFVTMSPEDALQWLEADNGAAAKKFRELRAKHAHRCYKEFDPHSKTWDIDPLPLVQTLQSNVLGGTQSIERREEDFLSIEQLPKMPTFTQRKLLKFLIPKAQFAVYAREATKSALVKCMHQIRLSLRRVGLQLRAEGRLPNPELVFFFTVDELYRFITTRNPHLLPRAVRRQKMHPVLDRERFPALQSGMPKPVDSSSISVDPNAQSLEGTPVSEGVAVGPARVIEDFITEASQIQKGDILITRATDTGWTPYFPLLGGVVTEIGGLLSHGAVVAREYGLPAIVGVQGVTEFVKTGDVVTLDGGTGLLHKVALSPDGPENVISAASIGKDHSSASAAA